MPATRTVDMTEGGRVVVRHVFFGRTAAEAKAMEEAHLEGDKSLAAALRGKPYRGIDIRAKRARGPVAPVPGFTLARKTRAPKPGEYSGIR